MTIARDAPAAALPPSPPAPHPSRSPVRAQNAARTGLRALSGRAPPHSPRPRSPFAEGCRDTPPRSTSALPRAGRRSSPPKRSRSTHTHELRIDARPSDFSVQWCNAKLPLLALPAKLRVHRRNNRPASRTPAQFAEGGQSAGPDRCGPRSRSPRRCLRREASDSTTPFPREGGRRDQNRLDYPQIADFLRRLGVSGLAIGLRGRRLRQRRR